MRRTRHPQPTPSLGILGGWGGMYMWDGAPTVSCAGCSAVIWLVKSSSLSKSLPDISAWVSSGLSHVAQPEENSLFLPCPCPSPGPQFSPAWEMTFPFTQWHRPPIYPFYLMVLFHSATRPINIAYWLQPPNISQICLHPHFFSPRCHHPPSSTGQWSPNWASILSLPLTPMPPPLLEHGRPARVIFNKK